jgi:aspartyl protease family protein
MARFSFNPQASSIALRAIVEGNVPRIVTLILDTGASYTQLPWRVVHAIGSDPKPGAGTIRVVTSSGVEVPPLAKVKKLRALGKSVDDLEVLCHDLPPEAKMDGLLGLNFLRHFNIAIRFKDGIIEIE